MTEREERKPADLGPLHRHIVDPSVPYMEAVGPREMNWLVHALGVVETLSRKGCDYGDSYARGESMDEVIYDNVAVRMADKIARVRNLTQARMRDPSSRAAMWDESLLDTLEDLVGYALLIYTYARLDGDVTRRPGPMVCDATDGAAVGPAATAAGAYADQQDGYCGEVAPYE